MSVARRKHLVPSSSSTALGRAPRQSIILLIFVLISFLAFFPPPFITSHLSHTLRHLPPSLQRLPNPLYVNEYVTHALQSARPVISSASLHPPPRIPTHERSNHVHRSAERRNSVETKHSRVVDREETHEEIDLHDPPARSAQKSDAADKSGQDRYTQTDNEDVAEPGMNAGDNAENDDPHATRDEVEGKREDETSSAPRSPSWKVSQARSANGWNIPPPLSEQLKSSERGSALAAKQAKHSWTQPLVIASYVRARTSTQDDYDVFVYVTGVTMGNYKRSLTGVGCLVGDDVYPVRHAELEVFYCRVWRTVRAGERVSLVLRRDEELRAALERPLEVGGSGLTLALERDAVEPLSSDVRLRLRSMDESSELSDFMAVRSDVMVREKHDAPADTAPQEVRYEICAATMMKQFPHLLQDWVDYHRRIGIDMVYIIDNAATRDIDAMFRGRDDVETIFWPWGRSQTQALSAVLVAARSRCEWLLLYDADEYVMVGVGTRNENAGKQPLRRLLRRVRSEGFADVRFGYITMGPSGHIYIPKTAPPEAYTELWWRQKRNGKTASLTAREWRVSKVHSNKAVQGIRIRRLQRDQVETRPVHEEDGAAIVHFQMRSMQEALLKSSFESASIGDMNLGPRKKANYARLKRPPRMYVAPVGPERRYEHFRDVWRAVIAAGDAALQRQTVVRQRQDDGRREVREWDLGRNAWVDTENDEV